MVSYKGWADNLRQYIANTPAMSGFKLFYKASLLGIIHNFLLYQGRVALFMVATDEDTNLLGGQVLLSAKLSNNISPQLSFVTIFSSAMKPILEWGGWEQSLKMLFVLLKCNLPYIMLGTIIHIIY